MPLAFDILQRASFDGTEFPVEDMSVIGVLRDHVHEYPHTPTGKPEKMGRRNYEITFNARFEARAPGYPNLWPDGLRTIREAFESEKTAPLHIPTIGTINAYIRHIRQSMRARESLSGERCELVFIEDNPDEIILDALVAPGKKGIQAQNTSLQDAASADPSLLAQINDFLSKIDDAVNDVLSVQDQAEIYTLTLESKIERLSGQIDALDKVLRVDQSANASKVIDALHDLWGTVIDVERDILNKQSDLQSFVVPNLMSVTDISVAIYGDTTNATELMALNDFSDALAIPPGFIVRYYPND